MPERARAAADWASRRRRRWSASRIAAAVLLHLLVLTALVVGTGRVEMPRRGSDRSTTLVTIALDLLKPKPIRTPAPPPAKVKPKRERTAAQTTTLARKEAPAASREPKSEPITLPINDRTTPTVAIAAKPPASAPSAPLGDIMNTAATRAAIRDAARGTRLSERGNDATHEEQGSTLVASDGTVCPACTRDLAPSPRPAERLKQGVAGAARSDCLHLSSAAGLLALPVLVYAEAVGKCSN